MSNVPQFTIKDLLDAGVHFGHKTRRWNPKMAEYIHSERNGVHIMDLRQTAPLLHQALVKINEVVKKNGRIIFVGTKPQAQEHVAEEAKRCGQYYINKRWLGGTLTNWKTISDSIRTIRKYEEVLNDETARMKKKERLDISRKLEKLEASIGGIKDIGTTPDLIIVIDTRKEELAIKEAKKLGIPVIAILDSNCDPEDITYPVPGNDDSIRAIKLYCKLFADAVLSGIEDSLGGMASEAVTEEAANANEPEVANDDKPKAKEEKPAKDRKAS